MSNKILFIIASRDWHDREFNDVAAVVTAHHFVVVVAAPTRAITTSSAGHERKPDMALPEVNSTEYAAIVCIGGAGAQDLATDPVTRRLLQQAVVFDTVIAALSSAVSILANAGLLIGKRATGAPTEETTIRNRGADYTGMQTEVDGRIVTAKDASAATAFGRALIEVVRSL